MPVQVSLCQLMYALVAITVLTVLLLQHLWMESQEMNVQLVIIALQEQIILQLVLQALLILYLELQIIPSVSSVPVGISVKDMVFLVLVDCAMVVIIVLKVLLHLPLVM